MVRMIPPSSPRFGGTTSRLCVPTLPLRIAFRSALPPGVRLIRTFLTGSPSTPVGPHAMPHHDGVPGPVARHRRAELVVRRVGVHLELAPDGRPRAVVALALDAPAVRVRPGAPVALPHDDEVPGPVARHRRPALA